jgi:hypothetical protein
VPATGFIDGDTTEDRAVNAAGWLAERGVTRIGIVGEGGGWTDFVARRTDLPGEIVRRLDGGLVELIALDRPLRVIVTHDECLWQAGDANTGSDSADTRS